MNKSMRILLLATALSGATSGMAFADDTSAQSGTLNFTGLLTEGSCVLGGQNITHDFGTLSKAQPFVTNRPTWSAYKIFNDTISVTNCPEEVSKVYMTPTFVKGAGDNIVSNTSGSAQKSNNVAMLIGSEANTLTYRTGEAVEFPVVQGKGSVDIPLVTQVVQIDKARATPGDASFDVTLAFDYK
ncbi:P pilus assembly protein, pilin FimA [Serratia quinivorans]|nr:P pilus assembly protein, pilin FimA [Serratia quinivorans]CAI2161009.1 P pilus assembly protein, pilin FimA [Serratia quinivorans]